MTEFDRMIEESLRRRAATVPAAPKSYGDVSRRIIRRRRRGASMATAAVTVPALAAIGWAVTRPEPIRSAVGPADGAGDPAVQTTTTAPGSAQYRCIGQAGSDGEWTYYDYCETTGYEMTTTTALAYDTIPAMSTYDTDAMVDQVLFVDGTAGQIDFHADLASRLGIAPRYELPATRLVVQTMVMPTSADVSVAYEVSAALGTDGFDTWTPDLIAGGIPDGIAVVVVIGTDWFDRLGEPYPNCFAATTALPIPTTTTSQPDLGVPFTAVYLPPASTIAPC